MAVNVKTERFEGPFDLLFHLIRKNEIDIYDIPIALLTNQYMEQLRLMPGRDMESMSEFVLMAATLMEIKSRMLLPKPREDSDGPEDPRAELVAQLIEYRRFKDAAGLLRERETDSGLVYYRPQDASVPIETRTPPTADVAEVLDGLSLELLYRAFDEAMKRRELKTDKVRAGFRSVSKDLYTVEEKSVYIRDLLKLRGRVSLTRMFAEAGTRMERIVTFLAALELIRTREIKVYQERMFGDIMISGRAKDEADGA